MQLTSNLGCSGDRQLWRCVAGITSQQVSCEFFGQALAQRTTHKHRDERSVRNEPDMTDKETLLFVSPRFLFPVDSGGKIRTTQILRGLKGGRFNIRSGLARDAELSRAICRSAQFRVR